MKHLRLSETSSTNDEARRAFETGEPLPLLISAARQTAGRGRSGRSWSHATGNFAGSFLVPATRALAAEPGVVSLLSGLAVRDALVASGATAEALALKWPNDALLAGSKVAGILAEFLEDERRRAIVIGIGVNLVSAPEDTIFPAGAVFPAGEAPDPRRFGDTLAEALLRWVRIGEDKGPTTVCDAWRAHAWRLGQQVTIRGEGEPLRGLFKDIDVHGRMVLQLAGGRERTISVGDAASG